MPLFCGIIKRNYIFIITFRRLGFAECFCENKEDGYEIRCYNRGRRSRRNIHST